MKRYKIFIFTIFLTVTANSSLVAQSQATLSENMVLSIPVDSPVVNQYLLNVSAVPFTTPEQMEVFFAAHKDDVVDFVTNKTDRTVYMILNLDHIASSKWAAKDINRYLEAKALSMRENYLTLPPENK